MEQSRTLFAIASHKSNRLLLFPTYFFFPQQPYAFKKLPYCLPYTESKLLLKQGGTNALKNLKALEL